MDSTIVFFRFCVYEYGNDTVLFVAESIFVNTGFPAAFHGDKSA